jgi:hypothetical protein
MRIICRFTTHEPGLRDNYVLDYETLITSALAIPPRAIIVFQESFLDGTLVPD